MGTRIEINTLAKFHHGNVSCSACTDSDYLSLKGDGWHLEVHANDVLSFLEAPGGAYDWRKRKIMETANAR